MNNFLHSIKVLSTLIFIGCVSCKKPLQEQETIDKKATIEERNEVKTIILKKSLFQKELLSNGNLTALEKTDLKFNVSEKLKAIYTKNGSYVKKGQLLAKLFDFTYQQKVNKAEIDLKQATLEFDDLKIRRGVDLSKNENENDQENEMMSIKSGYKNGLHQLENARFELKSTKLYAPFGGIVANLKSKQHEQLNSGETFLTLINDNIFEVEFYVIESELQEIKINDKIRIKPFANNKIYDGSISSINPQIEKDGTILIKARVQNDGSLIEGMNVKVFIRKEVPDRFVVPKSSIVIRDNQEVLFKVKNGKAHWTYVFTELENSSEYSIIPNLNKSGSNLNVGDTIITSGNINLAHGSLITIKKNNQ